MNGGETAPATSPLFCEPWEHVPAELKEIPQWVLWKFITKEDGKRTKEPWSKEGVNGSSTNSSTWCTFDQAVNAQRFFCDGIGFVLTGIGNFIGVDLDNCRDPDTGEIDPMAWSEIARLNSYSEVSPSGTGVHVLCRGTIPNGETGRHNKEIGREMYSSGRFLTVSGNWLTGTPVTINAAQAVIEELYHAWFHPPPPRAPRPARSTASSNIDDNEIIRQASEAKNGAKFTALMNGDTSGYASPSEADSGLVGILKFWTQDKDQILRIVQQSALWDEKWKRQDYQERTLDMALALPGETYQGNRVHIGKDSTPTRVQAQPPDPEIEAAAIEILYHGDILQQFKDTYATLHSGDPEIIETIVLTACSQVIVNTQGIQPGFTGSTGTGKSDAVQKALHLLPPEYVISATLSNKHVFYMGLEPGTAIYCDDTELSPEMNATVKRARTNFQSETQYRTLDKNRKPVTLSIPPRTVFIFSSVLDQGDEQLADREYRISLAKTPDADIKFLEFIQEAAIAGRDQYPVTRAILICREIIRQIRRFMYRVVIPFADKIGFSDPGNRRDVIMFFDFVRAMAVLNCARRERLHTEGDRSEIQTIIATDDDAREAARAFKTNAETQQFKLSRDEAALWHFIADVQGGEVTFPDLVDRYAATGSKSATESNLRRLLSGRGGNGGLLSKVAGLTVTHEMREIRDKVRRTVKVIRCIRSPSLYDYNDFVTLNLPCLPCPLPVRPLSNNGTGKNEPLSAKEDQYNNKINNNNIPCPKTRSQSKTCDHGGADHSSHSSLVRDPESGQGEIDTTEKNDNLGYFDKRGSFAPVPTDRQEGDKDGQADRGAPSLTPLCGEEVPTPARPPDKVTTSLQACGFDGPSGPVPSVATFQEVPHDREVKCLCCAKGSHTRSATATRDRSGRLIHKSIRTVRMVQSGSCVLCEACRDTLRYEQIGLGVRK